jgi:hypothetical protein
MVMRFSGIVSFYGIFPGFATNDCYAESRNQIVMSSGASAPNDTSIVPK